MTDPLAHAPLDAGADQAAGPDLHHLVVGGISRSWRWIVLLTALGAAIGLAIGVAQPNQYVSEAKLLLRVGAREMASSESMIGVREESSSSAPTGASPITSTGPVTGKAATGVPLASASSSTRPKVSVREGKTKTSARA